MTYVGIAIAGGLLLGIAVGAAKHFFIWRPYARRGGDNIYGRMAISMAINVLTLLAVFLLRGYWPYSFNFTIAAVAVGLSVTSGVIAYIANKKAFSSAGK